MTLESAKQISKQVVKVRSDQAAAVDDSLAVEEPLEIRLRWQETSTVQRRSVAVTMRTPGNDFELAAGFLLTEGLIKTQEDVVDIAYCLDEREEQLLNVVLVTLRPGLAFDIGRLDRNFYTTSSCGVCGKASLESLEAQGCEALPVEWSVEPASIYKLPAALTEAQVVFSRTGGLHAAGLFSKEGELLELREDVGRHNALDKLIGRSLLAGSIPLEDNILLLSGRASFELIQKALVARIPLVAAVGAPSSLAVDLADGFGQTLLGFVKSESFNIYSCPGRVDRARV